MRHPLASQFLALATITMPCMAQSILPTATSSTALSIDLGTTTAFSTTVPSGVLPMIANNWIGQPGLQAQWGWSTEQGNSGLAFTMYWSSTIGTPSASASLQGQGILLALSTTSASNARLELSGWNFGFSGAAPSLAIDVGDDGVAEVTELVPSAAVSVVLGPVPTLVRVRIAANQVGTGSSGLSVRCIPDNPSNVQVWNIGCESVPVAVQTTFDGNFELGALPILGQPTFGVLSLQLQPMLLGTSFGIPCLLLPAPDVVVAFPSTATSTIVVPAVLRPLIFFAQGVALGGNGLVTGSVFAARAL